MDRKRRALGDSEQGALLNNDNSDLSDENSDDGSLFEQSENSSESGESSSDYSILGDPVVEAEEQELGMEDPATNENVPEEDYLWTDIADDPEIFPFTGKEGFLINIPIMSTPKEIFTLFFDDNLLQQIVQVTNRKAHQIVQNQVLRRRSAMNYWKDTNYEEMQVFIGLCLVMGHVKMPCLRHYWSTKNLLYNHPLFGRSMSRERFEIILKCMQFHDPDNVDISNRLHKVDILQRILDNIQNTYYPGKELSLDEAMLLWRGRLIFRQYLPGKKNKYGIKFYELCTPDGFILNSLIYSGKGTVLDDGNSHVSKVVMKLMVPYLGKGHIIYMDNFYNGVKLTKDLGRKSTHVCGTLRKNRKHLPKNVTESKLKKGESKWMRSGNILVLKWKDKKDVLMISNAHKHLMVDTTNRRGQVKSKLNSGLQQIYVWNRQIGSNAFLLSNTKKVYSVVYEGVFSLFRHLLVEWLLDIQQNPQPEVDLPPV